MCFKAHSTLRFCYLMASVMDITSLSFLSPPVFVPQATSDALKCVCHWAAIKSHVCSRGATLTDSYKRAFMGASGLEPFLLPCDVFVLDDCCSVYKPTWHYHRSTKGHWRCCSQIKRSFFGPPNQKIRQEHEALPRYPFREAWKETLGGENRYLCKWLKWVLEIFATERRRARRG